MRRLLLLAAAAIAFLAVCVVIARWLSLESVERNAITELLEAQARGDPAAMLRQLDRCGDPACAALVRRNAARLRGEGELRIPLLQSGTAHVVSAKTAYTRVVWFTPGRLTTVQCVLVRRGGNVISGLTVSLLRVTAPIGRESSCPA